MIVVGLVLLVAGAELLVRGSVAIATRLGMSPLLIGLTLVSVGTSMPELVTTIQAALIGSAGIALGNVVGSNIANSLLIVGLAAMVAPISVHMNALRRDGVIAMGATVAFAMMAVFLPFDRVVGTILLLALGAYLVLSYFTEKDAPNEDHGAIESKAEALDLLDHRFSEAVSNRLKVAVWLLMSAGGIVLLALGGRWLVNGASTLAADLGVSDTIIGLTVVAFGTSAPELATSLLAAARKHADVAIGNIIGSNIFNLLGIAGVAALINPTIVPERIVTVDNIFLVGAQALLLVVAITGLRVARIEGVVLAACYVGYILVVWPK